MHVVSMIPGRIRIKDRMLKKGYVANRVIHRIRHLEHRLNVHYEKLTGSVLITYDPKHIGEREIINKLTESFYIMRSLSHIPSKYQRQLLHGGMLMTLVLCIASIIYKNKKIHTVTGIAFTALSLFHTYTNKRKLFR